MGPLLFSGMVLFASNVALGSLIASTASLARSGADPLRVRAPFLLLAAIIQGIGVLGGVEGLLAVTVRDIGGYAPALAAAVPGVVGGVLAMLLVLRTSGPPSTPVELIGASFLAGLTVLALVLGLLAVILTPAGADFSPANPWLVVAGIVAGGRCFGCRVDRAVCFRQPGD
jgi:hypothetical protein